MQDDGGGGEGLDRVDDKALEALAMHLRWMYDVVLREKVAESPLVARFVDKLCRVCRPLETHRGSARELLSGHPELLNLLSEGVLYLYASEVVFTEPPPTVQQYLASKRCDPPRTLSLALRWLSNCHGLDLGEAPLQQTANFLAQGAPGVFRADLHNVLAGFLLHRYCYSFTQPAEVIAHVQSFSALTREEEEVDSVEPALELWVRKVCSLFSAPGEALELCGEGLMPSVMDARALCVVFYKYDTGFVPIQSVHLSSSLSAEERIHNWGILLDTCSRSRINPPFAAEEVVRDPDALRLPVLWLVQMCFTVLRRTSEGVLGGCALSPDEEQQNTSADSSVVVVQRVPRRGHRYDPCLASGVSTLAEASLLLDVSRAGATEALGIEFDDPFAPPRVVGVREGMPGARAGCATGQLITAVDGQPVTSGVELARLIEGRCSFTLTAAREGVSFVRASMQLLRSPGSSSPSGSSGDMRTPDAADLAPLCAGRPPATPPSTAPAEVVGPSEGGGGWQTDTPLSAEGELVWARPEGGDEAEGGEVELGTVVEPPAAVAMAPEGELSGLAKVVSVPDVHAIETPLRPAPPSEAAEEGAGCVSTCLDAVQEDSTGQEAGCVEEQEIIEELCEAPVAAESAGQESPAREAVEVNETCPEEHEMEACVEEVVEEHDFVEELCEAPVAVVAATQEAVEVPQPGVADDGELQGESSCVHCAEDAVTPRSHSADDAAGGADCADAAGGTAQEVRLDEVPTERAVAEASNTTPTTEVGCDVHGGDADDGAGVAAEGQVTEDVKNPLTSTVPMSAEALQPMLVDGACPVEPQPVEDAGNSPNRCWRDAVAKGVEQAVLALHSPDPFMSLREEGPSPSSPPRSPRAPPSAVKPPSTRESSPSVRPVPDRTPPGTPQCDSRPRTPHSRATRVAGARPVSDLGYSRPPSPQGGVVPGDEIPVASSVNALALENERIDTEYSALVAQRDRVIERLQRRSARRRSKTTEEASAPPHADPCAATPTGELAQAPPAKDEPPSPVPQAPHPPRQPLAALQPQRTPPKHAVPQAPVEKAGHTALAARSRQHVMNALKRLCLPGPINASALAEAIAAVEAVFTAAGDRQKEVRLVLHIKAAGQPLLKSIFASSPAQPGLRKVYGVGPAKLRNGVQCLRYDSGSRRFVELPASFTPDDPLVDAVVLPRQAPRYGDHI
eukprot:Hpha_TRINITY_DN14375_c0_g1::TRINITY_DN14375_c0_g1_i1::g.87099::m.87099